MSFRSYAEANDMQSATTKRPSPEAQRVGTEFYVSKHKPISSVKVCLSIVIGVRGKAIMGDLDEA